MDHVVWQVLVKVAERVGVLAECLVLAPESVPCSNLSELHQVNHVDGRDVIFSTRQVISPVALLPEAESLHFGVGVTEGGVTIGRPSEVKIPQFRQISPNNLVSVHKDDFLQVEGEEDVKEEDLVTPDCPLSLLLLVQPPRPLVVDILVLEAISLGILRDELFQAWAQEVLQDPELDRGLGRFHHGEHHDFEETLIQVTCGHTEDVEPFILNLSFGTLLAPTKFVGNAEKRDFLKRCSKSSRNVQDQP